MSTSKRWIGLLLVFAMLAAILTGCGGGSDSSSSTPAASTDGSSAAESTAPSENPTPGEADTSLGVALIVNGNIGDKSFNDLAYQGLQRVEAEYGIRVTLVENKYDPTKYEPSIIDFSENPDYDILVCNSYDVKEIIERVAPQYPDKYYILYDADLDFDNIDLPNCYSMNFKQNEGSFLAGAMAAKLTSSSDLDRINEQKLIGYIAGGENAVINDFLIGYIQGAEYADADVKMLISYIGDFLNTAKGKEMALAMQMQGADIVFQVAGGAGMGVQEAAKDQNFFAIGVDDDQYLHYMDEGDPEAAQAVVTSMVKMVDEVVYGCVSRAVKGELPWGSHEDQGLKEGVVGIAMNEYYLATVPQDIQDFVNETKDKIISGEIEVDTNIGKPTEFIQEARDRIKP